MSKHVAHAAYHNQLFLWLQYTANCGYKAVAQQCFNFIKWNFQSVANTPDFSNFGVELLCDLLQQNDLIVYNEMVLYNCVVRWLDLQHNQLCSRKVADDTNQQYMERIVRAVMKFIRYCCKSISIMRLVNDAELVHDVHSKSLKYMFYILYPKKAGQK